MYFEECWGMELHNCCLRKLRRKSPGITGLQWQLLGETFVSGRQMLTLWSSVPWEALFYVLFRQPVGWRVEVTEHYVFKVGISRLSPLSRSSYTLTQREKPHRFHLFWYRFCHHCSRYCLRELISICIDQWYAFSCLLNCHLMYF